MKTKQIIAGILAAALFSPLFAVAQQDKISELKWITAPAVGKVGDKAEFKITGSNLYLEKRKRFANNDFGRLVLSTTI